MQGKNLLAFAISSGGGNMRRADSSSEAVITVSRRTSLCMKC